jgi:phosphoribosylformimino-5-aminoimidazole carboxamide ribotide isomerase
MDVYGRINILGGRSVRLPALDVTEAIILDNDPLNRARSWARQGADYLHVVDLNAAALGDYQNRSLIDQIITEVDTPVQVAGGIRSHIEAMRLLRQGAWRVVMGTAAIEDQIMIWDLCRDYPDKIVVSVDVRPDQEVVTQGFSERSGRYLEEVLTEMSSAGVAAFLVAEAGRNPLTEPLDLDIFAEALELVPEPVIVAGGVGNLEDLRTLSRLSVEGRKLAGVIVGREVTVGRFSLADAKRTVVAGKEAPSLSPRGGMNVMMWADDLEKMIDFYTKALGLREVTAPHMATRGQVWMAIGGSYLILRKRHPDSPPGGGAEIVLWADDMRGWRTHLAARGLQVVDMPSDRSGLPLDMTGVVDPEGNQVWVSNQPQII